MRNQVKIQVTEFIGTPLCISAEYGQKVFDKVQQLIKNGKYIVISFDEATMIISLFLHVAIGQLYGSFNEETIRTQVEVEGLSIDDMQLLQQVVDNAKNYYSNRQSYDKAWLALEDLADLEDFT